MTELPNNPQECPICIRVENKIRNLSVLQNKLSDIEIEQLVENVQNAILKKSNDSRGIKMAEDMIVLTKANFDELYEAQKYVLLLVEKMTQRDIQRDANMMALGVKMADVLEKVDALGLDVEGDDEEGGEEKNDIVLPGASGPAPTAPAPAPAAPAAPAPFAPAPAAPIAPMAPAAPMAPSPCEAAPVAPAPFAPAPAAPVPPMAPMAPDMQKTYGAGYSAGLADKTRMNGVPTSGNFVYPAYGRTISEHEASKIVADIEKSMSLEEIGTMSSTQTNAMLRQKGALPKKRGE